MKDISYALGLSIASNLKNSGVEALDIDVLAQLFPAVEFHEPVKHHFQSHPVQGILFLNINHSSSNIPSRSGSYQLFPESPTRGDEPAAYSTIS